MPCVWILFPSAHLRQYNITRTGFEVPSNDTASGYTQDFSAPTFEDFTKRVREEEEEEDEEEKEEEEYRFLCACNIQFFVSSSFAISSGVFPSHFLDSQVCHRVKCRLYSLVMVL